MTTLHSITPKLPHVGFFFFIGTALREGLTVAYEVLYLLA